MESTDEIRDTLASEDQAGRLSDITTDDVVVHPVIHGVLHPNLSRLKRKVVQDEPRAVHVYENDRPITIDGLDTPQPADLPLVHAAVKERFNKVGGYRPAALRGRRFRLFDEPIGPQIDGIAGLRD